MRKKISNYWGSDVYPHREAIIYHNTKDNLFEVEFWNKNQLQENRQMVSGYGEDKVVHSLRYAEDAAENWCLGYIP